MSQLDRFYRDHQSDVGVLLVALQDQPESVRSLMQQAGASLPVLLDPQGDVAGQYGIAAVPTAVIIDKQGKIADIKVGPTTAADLASATNALE